VRVRAKFLGGWYEIALALRLGTLALSGVIACLGAGAMTAQTTSSLAPSGTSANPSGLEMEGPTMSNEIFAHMLFNQLEGRTDGSDSEMRWDGEGWIGTDMNRAWFKSEGFAANGTVIDGDVEALYDHPLPRLRYFDGQLGVREDVASGPHRTWLALGIEGLAPGFFQFEPTVYFRDGGHVAGRITTSYDLLITQRLIAQPELEMDFYSKSDPQRRLGTGLSDLDAGLRLRYEISRKFSPYVGFAYTQDFGGTATLSRAAGESTADPRFVFGLRVWY
jgi:copper resistance protein B